jgi:hypothetical protein
MKDKKLRRLSNYWMAAGDLEAAELFAQEILDTDLRNMQLRRVEDYTEVMHDISLDDVDDIPPVNYSKKSMMDNMHEQLGHKDTTTTKEDNLERRLANYCLGTVTPYSCEQNPATLRDSLEKMRLEGYGIVTGGRDQCQQTKNDTVLVMVECVSQFRQRYVIEVDAEYPEYALDDVAMERYKEFSQTHLGEVIVSHRVVGVDEVLAICDEDNAYCKSWSDEKKLQVFVTESEYRGED